MKKNSIKTLNQQLGNCLSKLHYAIIDYVEKHQGEKGYINTQEVKKDKMYFYAYNNDKELVEGRICAIRAKGGNLQIIGTIFDNLYFSEGDIEIATKLTDNIDNANGEYNPYLQISGEWETYWQDVYGNDWLIYAQTLMSIGEVIEQY